MSADAAIISRTDRRGNIVDCNEEFVKASGYLREELIGKPHNVIRHPDMPKAAYRDLWATVKKGRVWSGIVKNRRKDGGYYWVRANGTPLADQSGFMSVRTLQGRGEVSAAEALYARIQRDPSITLHEGEVIDGAGARLSLRLRSLMGFWFNSVGLRIASGGLLAVLILALVSWIAMRGVHDLSLDGEGYKRIVAGKDLVADILPPPLFMIEAYLLTWEMKDRPAMLESGKVKLTQLQKDFGERQRFWRGEALPAGLKKVLFDEAGLPAQRFFSLAQGDFLLALSAGDADRLRAVAAELEALYRQHREAIYRTVSEAE